MMFFVSLFSLAILGSACASPHKTDDSAGCGLFHKDKNHTVTITSGNVPREFLVHLPDTYDENAATSVILSYHGRGKTMREQQRISGLSNATLNPDMIAVYPQGYNKSWEGAPYAVEGISDKVFTTDMLDYLRSHYCVDDSRIYATGKSNGGGFVNLLACSLEHGGDFAAFAIAAGAFYENYTETCKPARSPLPILEFHGSADMTIPYVGNTKRYLPPVPDWLAQWADRNGCTQSTNISEIDDRVYHTSYCGVTQAYLVEGMHHCWPSTEFTHENKHCGNQTKPDTLAPIEATSIMMNFFDMYTKPDITTAETDLDEAQVEMHKELF